MSDLEVRERLSAHVDGDIDVAELEDWLESVAWDGQLPTHEQRLVADALRLMAEHANGDWTDAELREQLAALNMTYWFGRATKAFVSGANAVVIRHDRRPVATGRSPVAEFA